MPEGSEPREKKQTTWMQIGRFTQLAFILPAGTVAGWLLGTAIDHWLHNSWFSIAGLILGTVAGFAELIRTVISSTSE
jgi:F0F1-type ATP synthase assembly protein I